MHFPPLQIRVRSKNKFYEEVKEARKDRIVSVRYL